MRILYGSDNCLMDVSDIAFKKCVINNILRIPINDQPRADLFTDVLPGILKHIVIEDNEGNREKYEYNEIIDLPINIHFKDNPKPINPQKQLENIHSRLQIRYGNLGDEYPEQYMTVMFLKPESKVLEIGGNIGRNSLIISSILTDSRNHVVLECDPNTAEQLRENRDINNMSFHIEPRALSKRPLIQKEWDTMVSEELLDGYKRVETITYDELRYKYRIEFDTLVLDCEGAFYYILEDFPEILTNIKTIIMENDYHNYDHKLHVDEILTNSGFREVYTQTGGWPPCYHCFYQVWQR